MIPKKQGNATTGRPRITFEIQKELGKGNWEVRSRKLLGAVCGMVLGGILVAGLWPFHSPKNEVTWLAGGNGLDFGWHGTILSSGKFRAANGPADAPCSLEIWFEPSDPAASGTLFTFYAPGNPRQFSLQQSLAGLALRSDIRGGRYTPWFYVGDIFRRGKPLFITVTSNGGRTSEYIDGVLARTTPKFPLSRQDFDGELVIASSPVDGDSWSGLLRGLAFYNQDLTPAQVYQHFATWTTKGRPEVSENERAVALYLFDERAGRVIHNQVPAATDLHIPDRYLVLDQVLLCPFWKEFHPNQWSCWKDILVNIAGFVPFGFLFCAYFSLAGGIKRPALVTILLGFAVSLTIESLQSFLPTRSSGTTDLITNTLGTCYGVWLHRLNLW
jgi:VanZ family protein